MATALFSSTIFGPVHSRRLGVSLGINLLPADRKICSFDCIYCECGYTVKAVSGTSRMPSREEVKVLLRDKLIEMRIGGELPDVMTFAGNGEPTLHPEFLGVIRDTIELRDEFCQQARVAVLSNASRLGDENIVEALKLVDDNILKLDSASDEMVRILDVPNYEYSVEKVVEQMSQFHDNLAVQTMFAKWTVDGKEYDNSTDKDVMAWLELIRRINPPRVMIYTIDRDTPLRSMQKVNKQRLDDIADMTRKVVADVSVSY